MDIINRYKDKKGPHHLHNLTLSFLRLNKFTKQTIFNNYGLNNPNNV